MISQVVKIQARYGVFAGVLNACLFIALYYMGRHPLLISPLLDFRILLFSIFIFFSLKEFREYDQYGILYFWQALIGSVTLVFVASAIASLGITIFGSLEKEFVRSYIQLMTQYLQSFPQRDIDQIGKEIYERMAAALPATNIYALAVTYFAQGLGIGFFISIILSVILRRHPKP